MLSLKITSAVFIVPFFFWPHSVTCRVLISQPETEPFPCQWKPHVLTTGPRGKSPIVLITYMLVFSNFKIPWTKYSLSVGQLFPNGSVGKKNPPTMQETQETAVWFLGRKDALEEEMATHSSILAWNIPWTEEPGGYSPKSHKESDTAEHAQILDREKFWTWDKLDSHSKWELQCLSNLSWKKSQRKEFREPEETLRELSLRYPLLWFKCPNYQAPNRQI